MIWGIGIVVVGVLALITGFAWAVFGRGSWDYDSFRPYGQVLLGGGGLILAAIGCIVMLAGWAFGF